VSLPPTFFLIRLLLFKALLYCILWVVSLGTGSAVCKDIANFYSSSSRYAIHFIVFTDKRIVLYSFHIAGIHHALLMMVLQYTVKNYYNLRSHDDKYNISSICCRRTLTGLQPLAPITPIKQITEQ
jgi:hypothetical protein